VWPKFLKSDKDAAKNMQSNGRHFPGSAKYTLHFIPTPED
jgi:hypothetical protein